jgi:hypothetical protein
MNKTVALYGAKSLARYTDLILKKGFLNNSWKVKVWEFGQQPVGNVDARIYQIHGAPQAVKEDRAIMQMIRNDAHDKVILVHRPDEVKKRYPNFKDLSKSALGIVFLGDKHIDDEFYRGFAKRFIVPHGFFDVKKLIQTSPIVIGSHTTWGEMRSTANVLRLFREIFKLNNNRFNIIGYLGGKPAEELDIIKLKKHWQALGGNDIKFTDAIQINQFNQSTIIVNPSNIEPENSGLTFNVQMYHLEDSIRTGESSGSLHAGVSIPVILEMNGSEIIEDLKVIKVPYASLNDIGSVDYASGAQEIISAIKNKSYISMLKHNLNQAQKFNNTFVAKSYIAIFEKQGLKKTK